VEHPTEPLKVRTRLTAVITAVAAAALVAGCSAGFDATSTQPYAPADGILANSGDLRVQNALVVASDSISSGVVIMTIANRGDSDDRLTGLTSPDGTVDLTGDTTLAAGSAVRFGSDTDPSATITALTALPGETITLRLTFRRAEPLEIKTVVVQADGYYSSITPGPTTESE
jgi:copper(I)-binding protein